MDFVKVSPKDNVAVAVKAASAGTEALIQGQRYTLLEDIPFGHKLALDDIAAGSQVLRYGYPIGVASQDIKQGQWVHSHNLKTALEGKLEYSYTPNAQPRPLPADTRDTLQAYVRPDGNIATRNELWLVPTVSCVNRTIETLAALARERYGHLCDGIWALPHNAGCSQLGDDHETTQRLLRAIVRHPNAGGVLMVSLGCENNDFDHFKPVLGPVDENRVKFMITQDVEDEIAQGLELIGQIIQAMQGDRRESVSASRLKLAFKCGASDAFSGVTANPLVGHIADRICALGGSAIMTEVPEMFGAETILMNRADSPETFNDVVSLINNFKQYYLDYNQPIYENPSPGNKAGGLTTLEEKSLGCIQKGGQALVSATLDYGQPCLKPGLNLTTGPGNDNVSITNLMASGAHVLLFTTGRGNPLGTAIPTIKVSSNNSLYQRKSSWIDFNAGQILDGKSFEDLAAELWDLVLDVASGQRSQSEKNGYREISIFKNGVLL